MPKFPSATAETVGQTQIVQKLPVKITVIAKMVSIFFLKGDCDDKSGKHICKCHIGWEGVQCDKILCDDKIFCNSNGIFTLIQENAS